MAENQDDILHPQDDGQPGGRFLKKADPYEMGF
jgi:hypothetical protein